MTIPARKLQTPPIDARQREALESALLRLATEFVSLPAHEIESGIERVLELVADFSGAACCGVSELDRGSNTLRNISSWARSESVDTTELATDLDTMEELFGSIEQPTLIGDVTKDPRIPEGFAAAVAAVGIRSLAWYPTESTAQRIVAIGITSDQPTDWQDEHVSLLRAAGRLIASLRERSVTENALEQTSLFLNQLSRTIDHHFFVWASDPPRVLYSNDAAAKLTGFPQEELYTNPTLVLEQIVPEDRESFLNLFKNELTDRELIYRFRHGDGSTRWMRTKIFPDETRGSGELRLAGLTEDVTERMRLLDARTRFSEFDKLLADVSDRLVATPLGEMDSAIHYALGRVGHFSVADRAYVYVFDRESENAEQVAMYLADKPSAVDDGLRDLPMSALPYFAAEILDGRTVVVPTVDQLPERAVEERRFLRDHGTRSCVMIPLAGADQVAGTMTLETLDHDRTWSSHELAMLRVFAEQIAAAVNRRQSEHELKRRINFERLLTSLVSNFMNLPADEIDAGIGNALETIARFVGCNRCGIALLAEDQKTAKLLRGWWEKGSAPIVPDYYTTDTTPGSLFGDWIRSDEPYLILDPTRLAALRPDATQAIRRGEVSTVASFALVADGKRIGWFGAGARPPRVSWKEAELRSLSVAADALTNMVARQRAEQEHERHNRLEDTLSRIAVDFIKRPLSEIRTGIEEIVESFAGFAGCERAAIILLDQVTMTASTYCEWVDRGEPAPVENFPFDSAPGFYDQLIHSTGPWIMHTDRFPETDRDAAVVLEAIGIRTLLNCPIADNGRVFGYASIGYSEPHHVPIAGTDQILSVAAGIVANALARQKLEDEGVRQREALAKSFRLGSLGQLATGIAHELNQPLTAIANYSRACARWLDAPEIDREAFSEILERVANEAIRAGDIIHNLRSHVKGGAHKRGSASVEAILDHASSLLAGTARDHNVLIHIQHGKDLPEVEVEPTEIEQVIINLVQNAIDSLVESDVVRREVTIRSTRKRGFVQIDVADNGPGVPQAERGRLFDQFHTTKKGGMGLGLSISRHLVDSNGGTLEALPDIGSGATFRVTLPIARKRHK